MKKAYLTSSVSVHASKQHKSNIIRFNRIELNSKQIELTESGTSSQSPSVWKKAMKCASCQNLKEN